MTHSRRFHSAWCPTSTTIHSATSHGKREETSQRLINISVNRGGSKPVGDLINCLCFIQASTHQRIFFLLCRSRDGSYLAVSSTDGYCSFLSFSPGELGTPLKEPPVLEVFAPNSGAEKKSKKVARTSSPGTQPQSSALTPTSQTGLGKDAPATCPPEEKKSTPSAKSKPQPRRITLNTLEGWGKASTSKTTSPQHSASTSAPSTPQPHAAPVTPTHSTTLPRITPFTPPTPKVLNSTNSVGPITPKGPATPKGPTPR